MTGLTLSLSWLPFQRAGSSQRGLQGTFRVNGIWATSAEMEAQQGWGQLVWGGAGGRRESLSITSQLHGLRGGFSLPPFPHV